MPQLNEACIGSENTWTNNALLLIGTPGANSMKFEAKYKIFFLGLALLTLSWDKNWDSHSLVNGYPSFCPRIALVAPSPGRWIWKCIHKAISGGNVEYTYVAVWRHYAAISKLLWNIFIIIRYFRIEKLRHNWLTGSVDVRRSIYVRLLARRMHHCLSISVIWADVHKPSIPEWGAQISQHRPICRVDEIEICTGNVFGRYAVWF